MRLYIPKSACSIVSTEPNTTHPATSGLTFGSYSNTDNAFGEHSKAIIHFGKVPASKFIYAGKLTGTNPPAWKGNDWDSLSARVRLSPFLYSTLIHCIFRVRGITNDFDTTVLTWNYQPITIGQTIKELTIKSKVNSTSSNLDNLSTINTFRILFTTVEPIYGIILDVAGHNAAGSANLVQAALTLKILY